MKINHGKVKTSIPHTQVLRLYDRCYSGELAECILSHDNVHDSVVTADGLAIEIGFIWKRELVLQVEIFEGSKLLRLMEIPAIKLASHSIPIRWGFFPRHSMQLEFAG